MCGHRCDTAEARRNPLFEMMVTSMKSVISSVAVLAGFLGATAANAGGYTPAVVDPVVVEPVTEVAPVGEWQGAYGGVTLGYAFGGDDRFGLQDGNGNLVQDDLGNTEISGVNGGLRVGYRWQRNKWVVGPELSVEGGSVKDSFTVDGTDTEVESKLKNRVALVLKTGYEVQPNTLAYGIAGVSRGSFDVDYGDLSESYNTNGYVFGVGVERKINERMSVTGEIEHNALKGKTVEFDNGLSTRATPEYTNVKLGLNFKF